MAAPNLATATTIFGRTSVQNSSITPTNIVVNSPSSGSVYKVNTLTCSNVSGTSTVSITVEVVRSASSYRLAYLLAVPPKATLMVIGKDSPIYLEEGDAIRITASANLGIDSIVSYEVIS